VIVENVLGVDKDCEDGEDEVEEATPVREENVKLAVKLVGCEPVDGELEGVELALVEEVEGEE